MEVLGTYSKFHGRLEGLRIATARLKSSDEPLRNRPEALTRHKIAQRLSPETIAEIVAGYETGTSTLALAERYGISNTAVKQLLKESRVARRRYHRLTQTEVQTAAELYEAGWSLARVGRELDANDETIRRALQQLGVHLRGIRRPQHH